MKELGKRIKEQRLKLGLSQTELANHIGIGQTGFAKKERGGTKDIPLTTAIKIAEKLNVHFMSFYGIEDQERAQQEDRLGSKELFLDFFMENVDFIKLLMFQFLGSFARKPVIKKLPDNGLFQCAGPAKKDPYINIEFKWTLLKKSGIFNEEDLEQFIKSEEGIVFPELKDWCNNHRKNCDTWLEFIPLDQLKYLSFYGIMNDCSPSALIDKSKNKSNQAE
jgi:transcriptional regulator with XRE-family HTH domain